MNGWITIGTKLDTNQFDKQITELEKKMKKEEDKKIVLQTKLSNQQEELEQAKRKTDELASSYQKLKAIQEQVANGRATPQQFAKMQDLQNTYGSLEQIGNSFDKALTKQNAIQEKVEQTKMQYDSINSKVSEYQSKINKLNLQRHEAEVSRLKDSFSGVGNSIENAIHKVGKLALGVFGIRSAFLAVRRASSDLASYNPQYAANLEYIRYALTQLIAPVLEYIVSLAKTVLAYINYIANAWFGVNLFANASAKSFNKVKQGIGGANKQAKELQKTLTGFDEMNILNSSSTGGGGGVGGAVGPDFDLADLNAVEIPDWIKWIANNKDIVIGAIKAIAAAFLIFKTLKIFGLLDGIGTAISGMIGKLTLFRKFLLGAGIATIIIGIVKTIEAVIKWIKDPTWENFKGVLQGLATILAGIGVTLLAINASNPFGWIALAIAGITYLGTSTKSMVDVMEELVQKYDKEYQKAQALKEAEDKLREARERLKNATNDYMNAVDNAEEAEKRLKEAQDNTGISIDDLLQKMDSENLTYKDLNENQRKVYKAYMNNKDAQDKLKTSTEEFNKATDEQTDKLNTLIGEYMATSSSTEDYKERVVKAYQEGKISAKDAANAISIALAGMDGKTREVFTQNIPNEIREGLNPNNYQSIANNFTGWWNDVFNKVNSKFSILGSALQNLKSKMTNIGNVNVGFSTGGYVTKMATGGLVNMPNKGVPVASAIAGESGTEGIIPLTDQQAMAQLGAEIGKHVLVNLTNITSMNGRVISRELKNISSEQDFAFNT